MEKSIYNRTLIVQQRIEERLKSAKKSCKIDLNKCPLLSKPSDQFSKNYRLNQSKSSTSMDLRPFYIINSQSLVNTSFNFGSTPQMNSSTRKGKSCLRNIFPMTRYDRQFDHLFVFEQISDLFISFSIYNGFKLMTHSDFRSFIR